jgi:CheY-like chemotaxis protein
MRRILVVEDNPDCYTVVQEALHYHFRGIEVIGASSGGEFQRALAKEHPDLVIIDLRLPDADGWQLLARMRKDPDTSDVPAVAITAYDSATVEEKSIEAGFDGYFSKPLDIFAFGEGIAPLLDPIS